MEYQPSLQMISMMEKEVKHLYSNHPDEIFDSIVCSRKIKFNVEHIMKTSSNIKIFKTPGSKNIPPHKN